MPKFNLFLIQITGTFTCAQKIKIIDSETLNPISSVRVLLADKNYYTNHEGFVLVPEKRGLLEITAFGYHTEKAANFSPIIKLKPLYNKIDEVKWLR